MDLTTSKQRLGNYIPKKLKIARAILFFAVVVWLLVGTATMLINQKTQSIYSSAHYNFNPIH